MAVRVPILVANDTTLIGLGYSRIEVWASIDSGNSYQEVTAASPMAAAIESAEALTTFRMGGKTLEFKVNQTTSYSVAFSSLLDYWSPSQVAGRINEVAPGVATVNDARVRLTSPTTGRASQIEITYSDAEDLGWTAGFAATGQDQRITLVSGTRIYEYVDMAGSTAARYKWRFSANGAAPLSEYSDYVFGSVLPLVSSGQLSVGTATFVALDGTPFKAKVIIAADQNPTVISGFTLANAKPLVIESDANGFIQFTLVRGAKVRVAIEGTTFVREITIPNAASFDLITLMADAPDPFTIQSQPPFLVRRSI